MRKFVKVLLIVFISIILLFSLTFIGLVIFVKPNNYKPLIIKAVEKTTSRHLTLAGDINWQFYPQIGFKINKVSLSNPADFGQDDQFVMIDSVGVSVALWPLLHHHVVIQGVRINGLNLHLIKNNTLNNWTFVSESATKIPPSATSSTQVVAETTNESATPFSLELQSLKITHTTISYARDGKQVLLLKDIHASMSHGNDGVILFDSKNGVVLKDLNLNFNDWLVGKIDFVLPDFDSMKYVANTDFTLINVNGILDGLGIAQKIRESNTLLNNLTLQVNATGDSNSIKIDQLNLAAPKVLKLAVNASIPSFKSLSYTAQVKLDDFSLNTILSKSGITLPSLVSKSELEHVSYQSNFSGNESSTVVNDIVFKVGDTSLTGNLNIPSFSPVKVHENLVIDKIDVDKFIDAKGYRIPIKNISLIGDLDSSISGKQQLKIENITLVGLSLDQLIVTINKNLEELNKRLELLNKSINDTSKEVAKASSGSILDKAMAAKDSVTTLSNLHDSLNGLNLDFIGQMKDSINSAIKTKNPTALTDLGGFNADLTLKNKVISPSDFALKGPNANIKGSGSMNLNAYTLNYAVTSQVTAKNINPIFAQLVFPSTVRGSLNSPDISLDWNSIGSQIVSYISNATKKQIADAQKKQAKAATPTGNTSGGNQIINSIGKLFGH